MIIFGAKFPAIPFLFPFTLFHFFSISVYYFLGLKPIQQRKLLRAIAEKTKPLPSDASAQTLVVVADSDTTQTSPLPMDTEPTLATSSPVHSSEAAPTNPQCDALSVRYIHCQNLFSYQAEEKALHNIPPTTTLEELISLIAAAEGVTKDMTLELFFSEGYPLDANKITLKGDICTSLLLNYIYN